MSAILQNLGHRQSRKQVTAGSSTCDCHFHEKELLNSRNMPDPHHHFRAASRFVLFALPVNIDQNSNANETEENIGSAIADKRQGKPLIWKQRSGDPDVNRRL